MDDREYLKGRLLGQTEFDLPDEPNPALTAHPPQAFTPEVRQDTQIVPGQENFGPGLAPGPSSERPAPIDTGFLGTVGPREALAGFPSRGPAPSEQATPNKTFISPSQPEGPFRQIPPEGPRGLTNAQVLPSPDMTSRIQGGGYPAGLTDDDLRAAQNRTFLEQTLGIRSGYHPGEAQNAVQSGFGVAPTAQVQNLQTPVERITQRRKAIGEATAQTSENIKTEAMAKQKVQQDYEAQQESDPSSTTSQAYRAVVKKFMPNVDIPSNVPGSAIKHLLPLGEKVYAGDIAAATKAYQRNFEVAKASKEADLGGKYEISGELTDVPGQAGVKMPHFLTHGPDAGARDNFKQLTAAQSTYDQAAKQLRDALASGDKSAASQAVTVIQGLLPTMLQGGRLPQTVGPAGESKVLTDPAEIWQQVLDNAQRWAGSDLATRTGLVRNTGAQLDQIGGLLGEQVHRQAASLGAVPSAPAEKRPYAKFLAQDLAGAAPEPGQRTARLAELADHVEQKLGATGKHEVFRDMVLDEVEKNWEKQKQAVKPAQPKQQAATGPRHLGTYNPATGNFE